MHSSPEGADEQSASRFCSLPLPVRGLISWWWVMAPWVLCSPLWPCLPVALRQNSVKYCDWTTNEEASFYRGQRIGLRVAFYRHDSKAFHVSFYHSHNLGLHPLKKLKAKFRFFRKKVKVCYKESQAGSRIWLTAMAPAFCWAPIEISPVTYKGLLHWFMNLWQKLG